MFARLRSNSKLIMLLLYLSGAKSLQVSLQYTSAGPTSVQVRSSAGTVLNMAMGSA
jgi:hypothetical protein